MTERRKGRDKPDTGYNGSEDTTWPRYGYNTDHAGTEGKNSVIVDGTGCVAIFGESFVYTQDAPCPPEPQNPPVVTDFATQVTPSATKETGRGNAVARSGWRNGTPPHPPLK